MNSISKRWLVFAIIVHVIAAWFSVGHYHDDEYAQILSFATSKTGMDMQSELMWEFESGVRSGFQPFVAYLIAKAANVLNIDSPFLQAFIYRLCSVVISLIATLVFIKSIAHEIKSESAYKWTVFFLLFSWILLFINVRFSSEGWATSFAILGIGLFFYPKHKPSKQFLLVGFLLGLAFLSRYQVGFMLFGFGLWLIFIHRIKPKDLLTILTAGFFTLLLGAAFDWWLYGEPTVSSWEYFSWHYSGMTSESGGISVTAHEPWWFYIQYSALQLLPPLTLFLPIAVIAFWIIFPKHPITWLTIPFVLFHQFFGHKEMRYLFPVLPFAPIMFAMVYIYLGDKFQILKTKPIKYSWNFIFGFSVFANVLLVILVLTLPASKEVALWQNCLSPLAKDGNYVLAVLDNDGSYSDPAELNLDFYNTDKLPITSVKDELKLSAVIKEHPDRKILYASRKKNRSQQLDASGYSHELICQALPNWLLKININNWTSRTSMWRIWAIE